MILLKNKPTLKKYILQTISAVAIIAVVIFVDLLTKGIAENVARETSTTELATVVEGFFYISLAHNTGAAFSFGANNAVFMNVVKILTFVVVAALLAFILFPDSRKNFLSIVSCSLIVGGAVGNLYDRLAFGSVRDFLKFYIFGWAFPTFNVADSALVVGVALLAVYLLISTFSSNGDEA